ncbi:MAG: phage terminase large subunit [Rickettsiaceae bacterium]|nr:phage terminase large subunit [Rickettsiaceae bacterium]
MNNKNLINAILKNDFGSFIHKSFKTLNPSMKYYRNWHIDLIAEHLLAVERGDIKRLIINMPPRCLKSLTVSVAWPAWLLGRNPANRIIVASYSQLLSNKLSLDTRFLISSDWYKSVFQGTVLHAKQNQKSKFMTTKYGFRFSTSVGGTATGEGGDILIVDDPHNPSHMFSNALRKKAINWFSETFSTRLNNRNEGKIVIVMQRLHDEDLSGFLIKNQEEEWHVLKIPIMTEEDTEFSFGNVSYSMKKNDTLSPDLFSKEVIDKLIKEVGMHNFNAQYLQKPDSLSSGLLKAEYLCYYKNLPEKFDYIIQSWDTAIKIDPTSDFSAMTCWGVKDNLYYLITSVQEKLEYPRLKSKILELASKYSPKIILIEDRSSGHSLIQDLKYQTNFRIISCKAVQEKVVRFATHLEIFEQGRVLLPEYGLTRTNVESQLIKFPNCKNDDIVDSISQFLHFVKNEPQTRINIRKF